MIRFGQSEIIHTPADAPQATVSDEAGGEHRRPKDEHKCGHTHHIGHQFTGFGVNAMETADHGATSVFSSVLQ